MSTTHLDAIVIRHATAADARAVAELAILDSREPLSGPVLIAEVDGVARAALDLQDGSVAADPFALTTELVELLHLHARSSHGTRRTRSSLRDRVVVGVGLGGHVGGSFDSLCVQRDQPWQREAISTNDISRWPR